MESAIKTIIVDDEPRAIDLLSVLLKNNPEIQVEESFTSPIEAINYVSTHEINLIFLDVQMPEISGIDFAKKLTELNLKIPIIFVTAHDQYLLEALRINAVDFLLKPVDVVELKEAILRVKQQTKENISNSLSRFIESQQRRKLRFNTRNGFITFFEDEILYVKADGVYSFIHLINAKEITVSQNIGKIEEQLQRKELIKIHRSVIANANYIFEINRGKKVCILSVESINYKLPLSIEGIKLIENFINS